MEKERDLAIDIVKFYAVLLIFNSHAGIMYPQLKILATSGVNCFFEGVILMKNKIELIDFLRGFSIFTKQIKVDEKNGVNCYAYFECDRHQLQ